MKFGRPRPKCGTAGIEKFESVRAGEPLSVGHVYAGVFAMFSEFEAFVCPNCGFTEFYRK